mmetsp:Transcript_7724/g.15352  ORF Transcript_7724/g.15352 Transcript_7724/m.15352 type:complete len:207 (-) Transcript_7724:382-1002(-)
MPKIRRKSSVRKALRNDLVLGEKPTSLAAAKTRGGEDQVDNGAVASSSSSSSSNNNSNDGKVKRKMPSGVEAARERRENKRERFLGKLRESKREIQVEQAVRKHGEALGNVQTLSEALSQSLGEINALRTQKAQQDAKKAFAGRNNKPSQKKLRNKARKQIQLAEVSLFKQVLKHPSMAANPVAAVQQHLKQHLASQQNHSHDASM